jgi:hypothetical protein
MTEQELVGVAEIAERAGVTPAAVANWRVRHDDFPEPLVQLRSGGVWDWEHVARWLADRKAAERQRLLQKINAHDRAGAKLRQELRGLK